jgi:hypothetical protein
MSALKRRKQIENLTVFVELLNEKKKVCFEFSIIRYQEIKLFGGYFSHLYELRFFIKIWFLLLCSIKTFWMLSIFLKYLFVKQ